MRLILDTHILLWTLAKSDSLPQRAQDLLLDPQNDKYASVVSLWEIAIKHRPGRGSRDAMPFGATETQKLIGMAGLSLLSVSPAHAVAVERLPLDRHAYPFDRMLVAQAVAEPMYLLTHDSALAAYGDAILLV